MRVTSPGSHPPSVYLFFPLGFFPSLFLEKKKKNSIVFDIFFLSFRPPPTPRLRRRVLSNCSRNNPAAWRAARPSRFSYPPEATVLLAPDADCCKIFTDVECELLQRVPLASEAISRIGSTDPAAMLFDAAAAFEEGDPRADEASVLGRDKGARRFKYWTFMVPPPDDNFVFGDRPVW